jgi:hypothetical protein
MIFKVDLKKLVAFAVKSATTQRYYPDYHRARMAVLRAQVQRRPSGSLSDNLWIKLRR